MPLANRFTTALKVLAGVLAGLLLVFLVAGVYMFRLSETLPDLEVDPTALEAPRTSVVYASDGSVLAEWHGEQDRTVVPLADMPLALQHAVVAIEDERFYEHNGVDLRAIARAFSINAEAGDVRQGGSTITQQLVKILFTDGERTMTRKIREALLAYELESKADKEEVLETYLNLVYFGHGSYGVESAANRYFGKAASELELHESALIAAIIKSPGRYSPIEDPEEAQERRDVVLAKMRQLGYITRAEETAARSHALEIAPPAEIAEVAPYFVEYVKQDLIDRLGADEVFKGGLRVYTTLEPALQRQAESAAHSVLNLADDPEVAVVSIQHSTGHIVSMVGGRDFSVNQFNLAVQGRRQPGSAFKPFVLVRALEEGVRPEQVFSAAPYSVEVKDGTWHVENYENSFAASTLTLRAATNWSVNAVYARLIMLVGAEDVVVTAQKMGITSPLEPNPAIALGGLTTGVSPLEMASSYGTIATTGLRVEPTAILRVTDDSDNLLFESVYSAERVLTEGVATQASLMLHDVIEVGTGGAARIDEWAAGKTGTTQSWRDAWFVGYAGDLSTAVWVGYSEGQVDMTDVHGIRVTGGSFPAQIWAGYMSSALAQRKAPVTPVPVESEELQATGQAMLVKICQDTMLLANSNCPNVVEIYLEPALIPSETCERH
ncbi:MAG: PBP1A family penicillin-binding protein [Actinomycetota bacterium]|nr:PBP1A family penicillin-binding protein [Actinomycetota bacterium]